MPRTIPTIFCDNESCGRPKVRVAVRHKTAKEITRTREELPLFLDIGDQAANRNSTSANKGSSAKTGHVALSPFRFLFSVTRKAGSWTRRRAVVLPPTRNNSLVMLKSQLHGKPGPYEDSAYS